MKFALTLQAELPFVLNLPSRDFNVAVHGGHSLRLDVDNESYFVRVRQQNAPVNESGFAMGDLSSLAAMFGANAAELPATKLRTVVAHRTEEEADNAALPSLDLDAMLATMQSALYKARPDILPADLPYAAATELANMTPEQLAQFTLREQQRSFGQHRLSELEPLFLVALNRLVRWYYVACSDFFVEEIGFHQLAMTTTLGVMRTIAVDGQLLETIPVVGKVPPLARNPWAAHPKEKIDEIASRVQGLDDPDFAQVLIIRSRHLVERAAFRNAVAEASEASKLPLRGLFASACQRQGKPTRKSMLNSSRRT